MQRRLPLTDKPSVTVAAWLSAYLAWAQEYYRKPSGRSTRQATNLRSAFCDLVSCTRPLSSWTRRDVEAWRQTLIDRGLCRNVINQRVRWLRAAARWAVRQDLAPKDLLAEIDLVDPLKYGRSRAAERSPVRSVPAEHVAKTCEHLSKRWRDLVRVQLLTGMRPGEAVSMRWDLLEPHDRWLIYRPIEHKTEHHGRPRVIVCAPAWLPERATGPAAGWVFPARRDDQHVTVSGYRQAIGRAARRADIPSWSPHQLRHLAATTAARLCGSDIAGELLGHAGQRSTRLYIDETDVQSIHAAESLHAAGWTSPLFGIM